LFQACYSGAGKTDRKSQHESAAVNAVLLMGQIVLVFFNDSNTYRYDWYDKCVPKCWLVSNVFCCLCVIVN